MKKYKGRIILVSVLLVITCLLTNSIASEWEIVLPLRVDVARLGTFVGFQAGNVNAGSSNSFIGHQAGLNNTIGHSNTFTGVNTGFLNTTGSSNTFTGRDAGSSNTAGSNNTFTGMNAGFFNTTGSSNTFTGVNTGFFNTTGSSNTFTGRDAGGNNTTGFNNTFTGKNAGFANTTGHNNVFTGVSAGRFLADGLTANINSNNSVFIGNDTRASAANNINEIVIGANTIGHGSNTVTLGNPSIVRTVMYRPDITGTTRGLGGAQILSLAVPVAPTVTPVGFTGTTTWGYRITARSSVGETLASTEGRITTGNATLSTTNFNRITWSAVPGAIDYRIYRTTAGGTPTTTGLIGTTPGLTFDDTGFAATVAVPTVDTSGSVGIGTATPAVGNRLEVHDGHIVNTMTTPPGVTCNVGIPTIIGTDMGGAITVPAGASSCTITFTIPWNQIYGCVVSSSVSGAHPFVPALSNTSATFNFTATAGAVTALYYHCSGR
ncbi:MAG: hypothetical protein DDT23_01184 [candidate division WS2 bacterium]|nr:hypothetical protein [Candidatus Lithacetigena glycinireducens]